MGRFIGEKPVVIDACGTKRVVVEGCSKIADKYGFTYVGGHPMAGTQYSGYKYAKANMFSGAPMVLVPCGSPDIELLSKMKELLAPAGFGKYTVTTAEKHDEMIAFTSQLAHVVSNAYVKSPSSKNHKGISAGSYKDLTRVAWLNPEMWAELFLENSDNLSRELGGLIEQLNKYKEAIDSGDRETLVKLLAEGRRMKEEADGR
jgi:prephenate dehydrogenase